MSQKRDIFAERENERDTQIEHPAPAPIDCTIPAANWDAELMSEEYKRLAHWERPSYYTRLVYDPDQNKVMAFYYGNYVGTLFSPQQLWDLVKAGYSEAALSAWRRSQQKRFGLNRPKTHNTTLPPEIQRASEARKAHIEWQRELQKRTTAGEGIKLEDLEIKI